MNIDEGGKSARALKEYLADSPSLIRHFNTENLVFDPCKNRASIRKAFFISQTKHGIEMPLLFSVRLNFGECFGQSGYLTHKLKTHYLLLQLWEDHSFPMINLQ